MYAPSNNVVPVTNESARNMQILFPNILPKDSMNHYRRGSFDDSIFGSFPPTPNNRDTSTPNNEMRQNGGFFLPPVKNQNDNQAFLSPAQSGWLNPTSLRQQVEQIDCPAPTNQAFDQNQYPMNAHAQEFDPMQTHMNRNENQNQGTDTLNMSSLPVYNYVSSWAMCDSPVDTPMRKRTGAAAAGHPNQQHQQQNDISKPLLIRLNTLSVNNSEESNDKQRNEEEKVSFHMNGSGNSGATISIEDEDEGKTMAELHELGRCRPCAYHCHKEDGCRRGESCTFCHMCGPEMLRARRKEKAKRIKSEMKLRKQDEKEKERKRAFESYINSTSTPTESTLSYTLAADEMLPFFNRSNTQSSDNHMHANQNGNPQGQESNNMAAHPHFRPYASIGSQPGFQRDLDPVLY